MTAPDQPDHDDTVDEVPARTRDAEQPGDFRDLLERSSLGSRNARRHRRRAGGTPTGEEPPR